MSFRKIFQKIRIFKYQLLSNCKRIIGKPKYRQPVQLIGKGEIGFGLNVTLGYFPSPYFYNGYIYIEARNQKTKIIIGDNVYINNNCVLIGEGEGIEIGSNTLIGTNCEIIDSDFHDLNADKFIGRKVKTSKVIVGKNVFIGNNVKIMKGVIIGDNAVVANGSVITKNVDSNSVVGGNPMKILRVSDK
jgi:acetyltransferase-like isoleucine patch superfamily enzyme